MNLLRWISRLWCDHHWHKVGELNDNYPCGAVDSYGEVSECCKCGETMRSMYRFVRHTKTPPPPEVAK